MPVTKHLVSASLICLSWLVFPAQAKPLEAFVADYDLNHSGVTLATTRVTLSIPADGQLEYRSVTKPAGLMAIFSKEERIEVSLLEYQEQRVRPLEYRYDRNHTERERHVHITFDWTNKRATNTAEDTTWKMEIPDTAMDKFGVQLALMLDMQLDRRPLDYPIADGGKLKSYRFEILAKEQTETPAGTYDTVHLIRSRKKSSRTTEVWLAPALGYLPVQILQTKEGKGSAYMKLTRFEPESR